MIDIMIGMVVGGNVYNFFLIFGVVEGNMVNFYVLMGVGYLVNIVCNVFVDI